MGQEIQRLARDLAAHAAWLRETGVTAVPRGLPPAVAAASPEPEQRAVPGPEAAEAAPVAAPVPGLEGVADLPGLAATIGDCTRCALSAGRTQVVFGTGDPNARLVFVGEGPGRDEDRKGEPFVGAAGQLLTDIIHKGMKIRREEVYICNVVKCRPPNNRNPEPEEVAACAPFLARQIDLVRPEVLVALGKFAAQKLLDCDTPISRLRGRWFEYRGIPVMPTFHPAYLLRNPGDKKLVWQDIQQVMARLGLSQ